MKKNSIANVMIQKEMFIERKISIKYIFNKRIKLIKYYYFEFLKYFCLYLK